MAQKSQTSSPKRRSAGENGAGPAANGNGHSNGIRFSSNGNGHVSNGNGHTSNGNGHVSNGNGLANGNGNGVASAEEIRAIAADMGNAMLATTSIDTARHSDDVELITDAIAQKFDLSESERSDLCAGARLHDIGKAAVPAEILSKPGPLDSHEWDVMLQHTVVGEQILSSVNELDGIAKLVRHSHERWDGDGYPDGLAGEDIPLGSRIIFCADAFHAVRSDRPYKEGRSAGAALTEIRRCSGTQFDPDVVAALETVVRELQIIGPGRRAYRSSRLTALLLVLAIGGGGSALAGSGLLEGGGGGDGSGSGEEPTAVQGGVLGVSAKGSNSAQGRGKEGHESAAEGSSGSTGSVASTESSGSTTNNSVDDDGSAGGGGGETSQTRPGGDSSSNHNSGSGSGSGGTNSNANSNSWAGGGSPGQSGNAPGHGGSCPGNSCSSPGSQDGAPGNSANAPGHQPGGPGNSGNHP